MEGGLLSVKTLEWAVKTYLPLSTELFCLSLKLGGERGNGGSGGGPYLTTCQALAFLGRNVFGATMATRSSATICTRKSSI
jgi:hypothetical protein